MHGPVPAVCRREPPGHLGTATTRASVTVARRQGQSGRGSRSEGPALQHREHRRAPKPSICDAHPAKGQTGNAHSRIRRHAVKQETPD
ncbi:hypothetical protein AAFF_G00375470 [Aldrovandia affinis]|uniref:Uncharacterized protein n=1 Tax=Aldrovandia affinis TaxID=143900 RepID=A0AAD7WLZ4_9TELE|nr:hypothetical protein AAFF_G00375470 [Aldrovandia affinis]